jgi:hypothetical protein
MQRRHALSAIDLFQDEEEVEDVGYLTDLISDRADGHEYLFDVEADERERANLAHGEEARLAELRDRWLTWNFSMPAIPPDATVSLGYSVKDMPQR